MGIHCRTPGDSSHIPVIPPVIGSCTSMSTQIKRKKLLYIDDEECLLDLGKLYIEKSGLYEVITCNDPYEAFGLIQTNNYDAIISDYEMPEINGIQLLSKVRKSGNNIPFIIFTGRGREEVVIAALNVGADFYIQKGGENK